MRAFVRLSSPRGVVELVPGDVIGRIPSAALLIDDPRVSEAHALVSLRRGALYLLSLRRMIALDGVPTGEVRLEVGQTIDLAEGLTLVVEEVVTPPEVLALRGRGLGVRTVGSVASILAGPPLTVVGRFVPGAEAYLWSVGELWRLRIGDAADQAVGAGARFVVAGHTLEVTTLSLAAAAPRSTELHGGIAIPLRVVAHYDTVEVHREGRPPVVIGGQSARLLSELVTFGGPIAWETCARQLWTDAPDPHELRHRWDVSVGRLRRKLRDAGLRADLIVSDRAGQVQLSLYDHDVVEDRT